MSLRPKGEGGLSEQPTWDTGDMQAGWQAGQDLQDICVRSGESRSSPISLEPESIVLPHPAVSMERWPARVYWAGVLKSIDLVLQPVFPASLSAVKTLESQISWDTQQLCKSDE